MASNKHAHLDLEGDMGYQRPGTTKFITIPRTAVGKFIGRGGSNIQSLQSKSGARIKLLNCQVEISGEAAQVKKAEKLIQDLVGDLELKTIKIGHTQIGLLIGAKGVRIKSIQEESGALIKIKDLAGGHNADAQVDITGTKEQIRIAEQLIAKAIKKADPITEMEILSSDPRPGSKAKLVLRQLDRGVKEQDLLDMYPDTQIRPSIVIRVEKAEVANYATFTFTTKGEMETWMHQLNGKMIHGRRIILKKK